MEGDDAAGVHVNALACGQIALDQRAARVHEDPAVAFNLLHDEAFAAEQAREDAFLQKHAQPHAARARQKAVFLADDAAAVLGQPQRQHGAGVGGGKGHARLAAPLVGEDGGEQALARDDAPPGGQQLVHQAAFLPGAVAEDGAHFNGGVLVHHGSGFGHGAFAGVQLHLHEGHVVAHDAVVDVVALHARQLLGQWNGRHVLRQAAFKGFGEFGHGAGGLPAREALPPAQGGRVLAHISEGLVGVKRPQALALAGLDEVPLKQGKAPFVEQAKLIGVKGRLLGL